MTDHSSPSLQEAAERYALIFGHPVPPEVLKLFAERPGALLAEITRAIRCTRAVPAWRCRAESRAATDVRSPVDAAPVSRGVGQR